jgi:C-terminal processing protease CtpA/Prc
MLYLYLIFLFMKSERFFLFLLLVLFTLPGCVKDQVEDQIPLAEFTDTEKLNRFVVDAMQELYLWEDRTDWSKYTHEEVYRSYTNSYELFSQFVYKDDRWSSLTDDIDSWRSMLQGVSTTYGYTLVRGVFLNTGHYFAIVLYASPGSPAAMAGLKRGDLIVGINGKEITNSNYDQLYDSSSIAIQLGIPSEEGISLQPGLIRMNAVEMYENPVQDFRILETNGHKIGYLCYTAYIDASEAELQAVFGTFKAAGVTDVVLDLRYNGGGYARTAQVLSSILAPEAAVRGKETYLTQQWNELYNNYWRSIGRDHTEYFVDTLAVNMDLKRLYVLTSRNTASASEATVIGLKSYLDVTLIGDTTHGKYYGGYILSTDDYYSGFPGYNKADYQGIANWGMYIMVYRYANKNNYPNFSGGLAPEPDDLVKEDYLDLKPFGDVSDPLLGRALERITGEKYVQPRALAAVKRPAYRIFPDEIKSANPIKNRLIHTPPLPRSKVE